MPDKPDKNKLLDESMQRVYRKVAGEMPDVKPVTVSPSSSASMLTRFLMPRQSLAVTNPFTGNITYDPNAMQGLSQDELENTMAHELTHSRQAQNTPWYQKVANLFTPDVQPPSGFSPSSPLSQAYNWRPDEMQAFQTERDRAMRMQQPYPVDPVYGARDVMLRKDKPKIDTGPSSDYYKKGMAYLQQVRESNKQYDTYGSALAKMKDGVPLTPEEQQAFKMYGGR